MCQRAFQIFLTHLFEVCKKMRRHLREENFSRRQPAEGNLAGYVPHQFVFTI